MSDPSAAPSRVATDSSSTDRAEVKNWLRRWSEVSPILEQERWRDVAGLTDDEASLATAGLLALWQPDWPTDDGEGLLLQQLVFARARDRSDP